MATRRLERIANSIKQTASETILYKLKDPRRGFVTVTRVDVTADLRHAKLYISILGSEPQQRTALRGLMSAKGFIQTEIAKNLTTRFTPEITFELDASAARSIEMSQLIDQAIAEDESRHPAAPEDEPADDAGLDEDTSAREHDPQDEEPPTN